MKRIICLLAALLLALPVLASEKQPLRVGALKGPTAMGLVKLMNDSEGGTDYAFTLAASPDALLPELLRGGLDVACLPVNLAAILYANTGGAVRVVAINTLGAFHIVERGDSVHALTDLAGRRLYVSGKASTPDYVLSHLLAAFDVQDVDIIWKAEHSEVLAALLQDAQGLALLPQPFATAAQLQQPDIRLALDLGALWQSLGEGPLITGVTVVRAQLIEQDPSRVAAFLADSQASVDYVLTHTQEAAELIEAAGILKAAVAQKALPLCGITQIMGEEMVTALTAFYEAMYAQDVNATGGSLPDAALYAAP